MTLDFRALKCPRLDHSRGLKCPRWDHSRALKSDGQIRSLIDKPDWSILGPLVATLGPSWNFSSAENLASLCLQDGPRSGTIF